MRARTDRLFIAFAVLSSLALMGASVDEDPNTWSGGTWVHVGGYDPLSIDLDALGQDIMVPITSSWYPSVDFSSADVWYFDPDATVKGDGSRSSPFRGFGIEVASDSTIARHGSEGGAILNAAKGPVVDSGDVCVLMDGNHGWIDFYTYYFNPHLAIISSPAIGGEFDRFRIRRGSGFYIDGLTSTRRPRYQWSVPGDMTDSGYDAAPYFFYASRDSNGNGEISDLIVRNCDFGVATKAEADTWSETRWDSMVVNAIGVFRGNRVHIEGNTGSVLNYFVKSAGTSSVTNDTINFIGNSADYMAGDGIQCTYMDYNSVEQNTLSDFFTVNDNHVDIVQFGLGSTNSTVYSNYMIASSTAAGLPPQNGITTWSGFQAAANATNISVVNNVIINGTELAGIKFVSGVDCSVFNNTLVGPYESGSGTPARIYFENASTNCVVANNIAGVCQATSGVTLSNNLEYGNDFTSAGFVSWSQDGDPSSFDLRLLPGSPATDYASATYAPADDIAATIRPVGSADDAGAYESN